MSKMPVKPVRSYKEYSAPFWAFNKGFDNLRIEIGPVGEESEDWEDEEIKEFCDLLGLDTIKCSDEPWFPDITFDVFQRFSDKYKCPIETVKVHMHPGSFQWEMYLCGTVQHTKEECAEVLLKAQESDKVYKEAEKKYEEDVRKYNIELAKWKLDAVGELKRLQSF